MIQNVTFGILILKYYFGHTNFLYSSTRSSGHHQSFLNFRFIIRKSQNQQKLAITDFTVQFRPKHLTHFSSLGIDNNLFPQHRKTLSDFTNFRENMLGVRNNICTSPFLNG